MQIAMPIFAPASPDESGGGGYAVPVAGTQEGEVSFLSIMAIEQGTGMQPALPEGSLLTNLPMSAQAGPESVAADLSELVGGDGVFPNADPAATGPIFNSQTPEFSRGSFVSGVVEAVNSADGTRLRRPISEPQAEVPVLRGDMDGWLPDGSLPEADGPVLEPDRARLQPAPTTDSVVTAVGLSGVLASPTNEMGEINQDPGDPAAALNAEVIRAPSGEAITSQVVVEVSGRPLGQEGVTAGMAKVVPTQLPPQPPVQGIETLVAQPPADRFGSASAPVRDQAAQVPITHDILQAQPREMAQLPGAVQMEANPPRAHVPTRAVNPVEGEAVAQALPLKPTSVPQERGQVPSGPLAPQAPQADTRMPQVQPIHPATTAEARPSMAAVPVADAQTKSAPVPQPWEMRGAFVHESEQGAGTAQPADVPTGVRGGEASGILAARAQVQQPSGRGRPGASETFIPGEVAEPAPTPAADQTRRQVENTSATQAIPATMAAPPSVAAPIFSTAEVGERRVGEAGDAELAPLELKGMDLPSSKMDTLSARADLPRHLAQQVADVARMMPDRPVELTLSPEELGRLRLTFTVDGGSMAVAVNAERPETLDLLRRHIDALAQELREIGYENVSFDFNQGGDAQGDAQGKDALDTALSSFEQEGGTATPSTPTHPDPARLRLTASGGIDIRL